MLHVNIYEGPPGCGKTYRAMNEMMVPGRYLVACPRVDLIAERNVDLSKMAIEHDTQPKVDEIHSELRIRQPIPTRIEDAVDEYRDHDHAIVLVTHEGMMAADLDRLEGWTVVIDELPTATASGVLDVRAGKRFLEQNYTLERCEDAGWSRVLPIDGGATSREIRCDTLLSGLTVFDKRAKSCSGLFVNLTDWSQLTSKKLEWVSLWTLANLSTADSVVVCAAGFDHSLLKRATDRVLGDGVRYTPVSVGGQPRNPRHIRVHYFTAGHEGSSTFWRTSDGRRCLTHVERYLADVDVGYWSGNEYILEYLEHRLRGQMVAPKQEGTNTLMRHASCAMIYSAKATPADTPLVQLLGLGRNDIVRARETEDLIQFVQRGNIRDRHASGNYDIYVYDDGQAQALKSYFEDNALGTVDIIPVDEAGIMDVERSKPGAPPKQKCAAQIAADRERRRLADKMRKQRERAAKKAESKATSSNSADPNASTISPVTSPPPSAESLLLDRPSGEGRASETVAVPSAELGGDLALDRRDLIAISRSDITIISETGDVDHARDFLSPIERRETGLSTYSVAGLK